MKIDALLEGMIKIPEPLFDRVMTIVHGDIFSRIMTYLDTIGDDYADSVFAYEKMIRRYISKFGAFTVNKDMSLNNDTRKRVNIRMSDIDPRYTARTPEVAARTYPLWVTLSASGSAANPSGGYIKRRAGRPARLYVVLPSRETIELVAKAPELFEPMIIRIEGVVRHELMHAIRDIALGQIPDTAEYYGKDDAIDDDAYYGATFEFLPLVQSHANEFIAYIKDMRALGYRIDTPDRQKQLLLNFVDPTSPPPRGMSRNTSDFFATLYRKDNSQWKKAVKLFYGLVRGKAF